MCQNVIQGLNTVSGLPWTAIKLAYGFESHLLHPVSIPGFRA
jgi:hypothetical protein